MMTTFAVAKQKRASRAKFAKVRTGCVTCKSTSRPRSFVSIVLADTDVVMVLTKSQAS